MMRTYYMILLRRGADGREYWRGTGFNLAPGGITYVGYEQTRDWRKFIVGYEAS